MGGIVLLELVANRRLDVFGLVERGGDHRDARQRRIHIDLHVTAKHRDVPRVFKQGRAEYLLPTVIHCESPEAAIASKEYMFPFVTVVECPEAKLLEAMGPTLVCTAITEKAELRRAFLDATHIDRLNLGPVPTIRLNWLQPHEGNIVDFLFRARAFQAPEAKLSAKN